MKTANMKFKAVVQMDKSGQFNQTDLAQRHGLCGATVSNWIRKAGCPRGSRGRPAFEEPTAVQMRILRHAWRHKYTEAGFAFDKQKQSVWRLVKRWQTWAEREFGLRSINAEKAPKKAERLKTCLRTIQPNVISFRVSDSILAKILEARGTRGQFRRQSLHIIARALLLSSFEQKQRTATSVVEPIPAYTRCNGDLFNSRSPTKQSIQQDYGTPSPQQ